MVALVEVAPGVRLWVETSGRIDGSPLLLIMGANASGLAWPDVLVAQLGEHHRVIRYDHRDTGRSTWAFDEEPYAITDLASDAVAVLDRLAVPCAHVVGMSMGGTLVQLLLLDHPQRLRSAALFATAALGAGLAPAPDAPPQPELPGPGPQLLELWQHFADPRTLEEELEFRVEHWRILNVCKLPFDASEFRALEQKLMAHAGRHDNPAAHARASQGNLDRAEELAAVRVPTLVIEAPEDPINPPPHAQHLADLIGSARLVTIPGMGHALGTPVLRLLADAILAHTRAADMSST
jgi:pimeloyl-ACP methyl ester carboxylesterase